MRHPLRTLITVLSLLLCLGLLLLWVRSHGVRDWVRAHRVSRQPVLQRDRAEALTHPGVLVVTCYRTTWRAGPDAPPDGFAERLARDDGVRWDTLVPVPWPGASRAPSTRAWRMGFAFVREPGAPGFDGSRLTTTTVAAPIWALASATGIAPVLSGISWARRQRRRRRGLCPKCNYDLRASPERCPECGEAVTT